MDSKLSFRIVLLLLALAGVSIAVARSAQTGMPFLPGLERAVWLVEARIDFDAEGDPITASLSLPDADIPGFELVQEQAASPGYGFSIVEEGGSEDGVGTSKRRAQWTRRSASGDQALYYSAQFVETGSKQSDSKPAPQQRQDYPVYWDEAEKLAASAVLERARATSSSAESFTRELIKLLNDADADQNAALLRSDESDRARLLMNLLEQEGIVTRSAMGLYLEDARRRQPLTPMVEIFSDGQWLLFDPESGATGLQPNLLLWHRGGVSVLDVTGGSNSRLSFSMIQQTIPATRLAGSVNSDSIFNTIGMHALPIEEQSMFKLLLLLPLGAAVVVFMRVLVGIKTAGTFMPILIALAFLQTALIPGLISFVSVVMMGLVLRGYLSRLNLLLVARIATLIVLVIFLISALSIIGYQLGYSTGMTITFFPMIIIAWTIERMSILWEEEGAREVMMQGGGSMLVAVLAYLLMQTALLKHLTFNFPELNLVLLALILAMGNYTGYRLTELRRFRDMAQD